jgi:hypothetical protein
MDWPGATVEVARTIAGPLIGAAIAIFTMRRQTAERLSLSIIWDWGHPGPFRDAEEPRLYVQNRGDIPVMLASVELRRGIVFRRKSEFPLSWIDEPSFSFPYRIEPGETWSYQLDKRAIFGVADDAGRMPRMLGRLRIPYVVLRVRTMAGSTAQIDAADATPFINRPKWLER